MRWLGQDLQDDHLRRVANPIRQMQSLRTSVEGIIAKRFFFEVLTTA